jgi:HEAT repeat protein
LLPLWQQIEAICLEKKYGKGRESLVMLLGQYGGKERVPVLLQLLSDPEAVGHALYALRLLGAPDAQWQAEQLVDSPRTLVRKEARKYLAKVRRHW